MCIRDRALSQSVNFKWVLDKIRISGIKVIQKRVSSRDTVARVNVGREKICGESEE